jgi:hypothetical protein
MGIVADLPNSTVDFRDPKKNVPMGPISNSFLCVQHAFEMTFSFGYNPDPKKGFGGTPKSTESWRIGIVQNALYEMYNFEYDDGSKFKIEFSSAVVDSGSDVYQPFYNDPVIIPACQIDPILKCDHYIPVMIPFVDVSYSSLGYSEFPDPWTGAMDNKPTSVNMVDEPFFGARLRLKNGALIKRAESISAFQTWLVAQHGQQTDVLATVPAFSLVFWLETQASPNLLGIGTPAHTFAFYGEAGISRHVKASGGAATVQMQAGNGRRAPVMTGPTANDRANGWLKTQGLVPDPVVFKTP